MPAHRVLALALLTGCVSTPGGTGSTPAPTGPCGPTAATGPAVGRAVGPVDPAAWGIATGESTFLGFLADRDGDGSPELLTSVTTAPDVDTGLATGGEWQAEHTTEVQVTYGPIAGEIDPAAAAATLFDPRDAERSDRFGPVLADADLDADGRCDLLLVAPGGARLVPSLPASGRVAVDDLGFLALAGDAWWSPGDVSGDGIADLVGTVDEAAARVPGPITGPVDLGADVDLAVRDPDGAVGLDAVADLDGDGLADWLVESWRPALGGYRYEVALLRAPAAGEHRFDAADARVADAAHATPLPDLDGDGVRELLLETSPQGDASFASGALPAGVVDLAAATGWSLVDGGRAAVGTVRPFDGDQDGLTDLLVEGACGAEDCVRVIWGPLPTSGAHDVAALATTWLLAASARPVGDVDGDGYGDLVTLETVGAARWTLVSGAALHGP